jgi:hypothetical protein
MGWTGMYPPAHGDKKRWLLEEFNQAGEVGTNPSWTLSDLSIKGNTAYGIYICSYHLVLVHFIH